MKLALGDYIIIALVVLCAAAIWLFPTLKGGGQFATISQRGETREVSLKHDAQISVDGAVIEVNNGRIRILESDCPDKICVKTGWISRGGQTIACVPLGIVITISGAASHDAIVS